MDIPNWPITGGFAELLMWPGNPEPVVFTLGSQTITAMKDQKTLLNIDTDGSIRLK